MICENCGIEHDGTYGSGRFCSDKCARSYSTKYVSKYKIRYCIGCNSEMTIKLNSNECYCSDCKPKGRKIICKICGNTYFWNKPGDGCSNDFCKKHNSKQFGTLIKYFGFDIAKYGTNEVEEEFNRVRSILYNLYWNENLCGAEIGEIFGYKTTHNITQQIFKYLDIPTRSSSKDHTKVAILKNRLTPGYHLSNLYYSGWHITWDNKEVYLRSSYELDYAKILDEKHIKYEVEKLRIKYFDTQQNEYRCAIPDFYLEDTNEIAEIKSNYTLDILEMKDKVIAYKELGYSFKLILEHKETNLDDLDPKDFLKNIKDYH